jgi:hypothetical protein
MRAVRLIGGILAVLLIPVVGAAAGLAVGVAATVWWLGPSDPLGVAAGAILTLFVLIPAGAVAAVAVASLLADG